MRKKKILKLLSVVLVTVLISSTVGVIAYAVGADSAAPEVSEEATPTGVAGAILKADVAAEKEETVYVIAAADGSVKKIIVSDWLKNPNKADRLTDKTELSDDVDIKGDAQYTMNPNNMRVWNADGNDVYYQGTIEKPLPVDVAVSYKLNGKAISSEELAGKSGEVSMRFDYTNNQKKDVEIDGKTETIYVPFIMMTGMMLDNEIFSDIRVSNGKLVNDGDRSVIMGFAMPGMQENLGIDKNDFEIPSYVEVTANVNNFALTTTLTVATNDIFNSINLDGIDSLDSLGDSLGELQSASQQLIDGSSALYGGLSALLEKSGELVQGIDKLYAGAKQLKGGAESLNAGSAELNAGVRELNAGLEALAENSDSLNGGAKQVFDSLLSTADSQLAAAGLNVPKLTVENYKATLNSVLGSMDKDAVYNMAYSTAKSQVTKAVYAQEATVRAQVEATVRRQVLEAVLASLGQPMSAKEYELAVAGGQISEEMQEQISEAVEAQINSEAVRGRISSATSAKLNELIETNMKSAEVQSQITAAVSQAQAGAGSINALIAQLDSYNEFYKGVIAYTDGVSQACAGSRKLTAGSAQIKAGAAPLADGADELYEALGALKSGSGALVNGVAKLNSGAMQLSDGMKEFNEKGVRRLTDVFDGDLNVLITRLKATSDVSKAYQSFAGIADGTQGSVKFIYKTDSIGEQ